MICKNGTVHHHTTATEARACWNVTTPPRACPAPATEGMYCKDGVIYKVIVAVHGSGRLYAQALVEGRFQAWPGMINHLNQSHRMTVEQAAEYGALYGRCIRCQAPLTDPDSIERGMGPVCATKI